jgi:hypothetical protein
LSVDQDWHVEVEGFDAARDLPDLPAVMAARVLRIVSYDAILGLLRLHRALFRRAQPSDRQVIALPAWLLGHDPAAQIICVSYGQELSDKLARDCRTTIMSGWYQALFPTRLSAHKQAVQEFVTTKQGFRLATSVRGVLTGRGADFIIIDDPLKPDEALSESQRRGVNNWRPHPFQPAQRQRKRLYHPHHAAPP